MKVTFLGTGTSHGVPVIGCRCGVCTSRDPRDRRTRSSVYIETGQADILIDITPEFRIQTIRAGIDSADALLLTHAHSDHVGGFDDIRPFCREHAVPVYGNGITIDELRRRFDYIFRTTQEGGGKPRVSLEVIDRKPFFVKELRVQPIPVLHGGLSISGYRIGAFGYVTDCSRLPGESLRLLSGCSTLVINGLRHRPHPTHLTIKGALDYIAKIGPERAYITHLCHDLLHEELSAELPEGVYPAYDGLVFEID
ncbi:MAG: MBL fold metallo-hydrolase [Spirochaetia bacterium]